MLHFCEIQYLGCVEVFESRGMQVCEEALKVLRVSWNYQREVEVSDDGFLSRHFQNSCRIRDGGLYGRCCTCRGTVCGSSRTRQRGWSSIRRSRRFPFVLQIGITRRGSVTFVETARPDGGCVTVFWRWKSRYVACTRFSYSTVCVSLHVVKSEKSNFIVPCQKKKRKFHDVIKESIETTCFLAFSLQGERLSHAVGCAFAACLERKQRRDKECGVTMTFDSKTSTFTRSGSFKHPSLTERLQDSRERAVGQCP